MQTHLGEKPLSILQTYRLILAEGGYGQFLKGAKPLLVRGYFVNIVTLPMFDYLTKVTRKRV